MTEEQIKKIEQAIKLLNECLLYSDVGKSAFSKGSVLREPASRVEKYSGLKGGTLLLIERGFFDSKKTLEDVHSALDKEQYIYSKKVVGVTIGRLAKPSGPLIKIEEGSKRLYVKRK